MWVACAHMGGSNMKRLPSAARLAASASLLCGAIVAAAGITDAHAGATQKTLAIYATYYGWYTNTPPGCQTAYTTCAGGEGTYTTPITFAADPAEFAKGTLVYYPTVDKYFVMGDTCTECITTFRNTRFAHIDLWMGGSTSATAGTEFTLIDCEDALTQARPTGAPKQTKFVITPPKGLAVSSQPLFTSTTGECYGGATITPTFDRYKNKTDAKCIANPTYSATAGTAAHLGTCSATSKGEDLEYEGDFFINHGLCLAIDKVTSKKPTKTSSALKWTTCTGKTTEEFEMGSHSTIEWIEYVRCVDEVSGELKLAQCPTTSKAHMWTRTAETPSGLPSAPEAPTASPGDESATVSWTASRTSGSFAITRYVVTSDTGNHRCVWTSGPRTCTVGTLTNGTAYTFTVTAHNLAGTSPASASSAAVTPNA